MATPRYDEATKQFAVLSWDLNLAFNGTAGPSGMVGGQAARPGGPGGRSNILVQRFQANPTFAAMYNQAKTDLKAQLYARGEAAEVLSRWSGVLSARASDLVDAATVEREAANVSRMFG